MGKLISKKIILIADEPAIYCPGCKYLHRFNVQKPSENGAQWTWNGDDQKPTFAPSMLVNQSHPDSRCHSFVRDGEIQFLEDCHHDLAGKTVELPDLPDWVLD